jgi:hypothetical protein
LGAWGPLAYDNDEANDWAYSLDDVNDLTLVEAALSAVEASRNGYLEQSTASEALAACEVLARLKGKAGYANAYTEKVDRWVAAHPITPPDELVVRGNAAIDRILGGQSELHELWAEAGDEEWVAAMADLRQRLT